MLYSVLDDFPKIKEDESIFYGGDQDWYPYEWQRWAGCASVAGANLAAFYDGKRKDEVPTYEKEVYVQKMLEMYQYMTPGIHGFPNPEKYLTRFLRYQLDRGYLCRGNIFTDWDAWGQASSYIIANLKEGHPIALLILRHQAKVIEENTWHWMVIVSYDDESHMVSVSNHGKIETYEAKEIFLPEKGNQVWLVSFDTPKQIEEL